MVSLVTLTPSTEHSPELARATAAAACPMLELNGVGPSLTSSGAKAAEILLIKEHTTKVLLCLSLFLFSANTSVLSLRNTLR